LKRQQQPEVKIKLKKYRERPDRKIIAKKYQKIYYDIPTNKEKSRWYQRQEKYKIKKNKRHNIRYKNDILYNLKNKMRGRLKIFFKLKNIPKRKSTMKIVGCSPQELKQHIEKQFDKNMNWGLVLNGEIHIDHDTPLDTAKTEEDVYRLFHYSNLQPLLAKDNLSKGAKLNWIKPDNRIKSDK